MVQPLDNSAESERLEDHWWWPDFGGLVEVVALSSYVFPVWLDAMERKWDVEFFFSVFIAAETAWLPLICIAYIDDWMIAFSTFQWMGGWSDQQRNSRLFQILQGSDYPIIVQIMINWCHDSFNKGCYVPLPCGRPFLWPKSPVATAWSGEPSRRALESAGPWPWMVGNRTFPGDLGI